MFINGYWFVYFHSSVLKIYDEAEKMWGRTLYYVLVYFINELNKALCPTHKDLNQSLLKDNVHIHKIGWFCFIYQTVIAVIAC